MEHVSDNERAALFISPDDGDFTELTSLFTAHRLAAIAPYREALTNARVWIASLTVTDMNEIVADGGITAGMVVGQEAIEQVRRIDKALTQLAKGSE